MAKDKGRKSGSSPPSAKRRRLDFSDFNETFKVIVGKDQEEVVVHKAVLTKSSNFFQICCGDKWQEGKEKTIALPDVGRETFATYLHWLYSSELIINTDRSLGAPEENDLAKAKQCNAKRSWLQLADLAIFADAYHDLNLHNAVVNSMVEAWEKFQISPNAGNIKLVWLVLPRHSKVRELYMDMVCSIEPTWFEYSKAVLHAEFIFDFMRNLLEERLARVQRPRVTQKTRCKYHEHNEKIPKCT